MVIPVAIVSSDSVIRGKLSSIKILRLSITKGRPYFATLLIIYV